MASSKVREIGWDFQEKRGTQGEESRYAEMPARHGRIGHIEWERAINFM